jgi:mannosyltransferase OCH1-like enzyme
MPDEYERYGESWRRHHPDWELRLWTDAELPELRFPEAFEKARNFGERSDLLRYEILVREGGVYVDTDVECKQPIDPLLDGVAAFAGWVRPQKVGNAIIGAVPGHPAIERMLEEAQARAGSGHVSGATGPRLLTEVLTSSEDVTIFAREVFYPFHPRRSPEGDVDHPGAYAIHHVEASWKTSEQLREDIRKLRNRLESTEARTQRTKQASRTLRKRVRRVEDRGRKLDAEIGRKQRRLGAIERSRWWRLRRALGRALRPLRAARAKLGSGRGRG